MNTYLAVKKGIANRGKEPMVFDWDRAAQIIKERKPKIAMAGLKDDWEWTGGTIYENNVPVKDSCTYLSSVWAIPELDIDGEIISCYKMQSSVPYWDSDTSWPESALEILNKK